MKFIERFKSEIKGGKTGFVFLIIFIFLSKSITAQSACDLYFDFITHPTSCYASNGSFIAYATDLPGNPCKRKIEVYKGTSLITSGFEEVAVNNLPTGSYEVIAYNDCGCIQVQSKIVEISGGSPTPLTGHLDIGNGYLKQVRASVCKETDIKIGTQSLGLNGFTISGPNGFSSSVPDGNTFWVIEDVKPVQSGVYRILYQNNQGCISETEFSLTVKDLKVNVGPDFSLCKGQSKNIIPQVSGQSICRGSCNTDSSKVLVRWNLNNCNAIGYSNQNNYSEFTPLYPHSGNCLEVNASNVFRNQGGHSCTPSIEQIGMCIPALQQCDPTFYNPLNAVKFSVLLTPEKTSRLTKLTFYEQSPLEWQTTDGNSGINNYNTKFLVKIYKNGNLLFNNVNFETQRTWNLVEIDLSILPEFTSHETALYEFELMGYCVVNQGGILSGWEIDDFQLHGTCCTNAPIFDNFSYLWSNGSTNAFIRVTPTESTSYSVTITDCDGCIAIDSVFVNSLDNPEVNVQISTHQICIGGTATLTATGGGTYLWNTGQTTPSISVNPAVTTIYSVTVTDANGCSNTSNKTLNVLPLPNVSITGPEAICTGGSATLTATGGGTYLWNTGQTTPSISINPAVTTIYSVTVTDANGCSNTSNKTLNVLPLPNVSITGPEAICTGGSATLTATGGGTYLWNTGQTTPSISVNPTITTTYSVTVTDSNGCTNSTNKTLNELPLPIVSITGPDGICVGGTTTFTATGGGSYLWNTGQTSASISLNPSVTTTYSVTVTDTNGCSNNANKTLNVLPLPNVSITGPEAICTGGSVTFTASGSGSYLWSTGQTTASISVNPAVTTTYSVTVTDTNACRGSDDFTLTVLPLPDITISGKDTICVGECTTLTASGGVTYQWNVPSNADCDGGYFIGGQQNNGPQSLYRFTAAGALQLIGATNTTRLNGNGFYCQNNNPRLFGMVRKGDAITTAIRADFAITDARSGNTQVLGEIPLPPNPYGLGGVSGILNFIGEVTPQGNFLFPAISALINPFTFQIEQYTVYIGQIDVNNHGNGANVTYVPLTIDPSCDPYMEACVEAFRAYALNPAGREPSGGIQDWTLSPDGNSLYAFLGIENGLLRIDLPSRTAFCTPGPASNLAFTGTVGAQTDEFGGMYFDNNRLIGWQVDRGRLFEINPSTGALSLISSSLPLDYRGDNATCIPCGTNDNDEPSITVCPEENTSYTVIVTDANGCTNSKSVTVVVKQNINVSISGDHQVCVGESSVLTASGGSSYIWSTGQTTPSISVNPAVTTTYSVTVTDTNACRGSDDFTLTILPLPDITISGKDTICVGECTTLTASGGVTYQWNVPSNADCDGGYFIGGQQNNGPQSLYRFTAAGALQLIGATNTTRLNGNGFYCQNNNPRLFGMVRKGDAITTAIRADFAITDARSGNTQVLGEIPLPPNPYGLGGVSGILNFIGEVTPQGNFLFPAISALINPFTFQIEQYTVYIGQIDVNNHGNGANVTYVPLTIDPSCDPYMEACVEAFRAYALNPAGREPSGGIQDWTLSPDGNSLYAFLGIENGLLRIDLPSRTAFCTPGPASNLAFTGTVGAQTDEFGGMYFDNNRLIGWQVDRGRLFEINPSTGALSLISSSLPLDYRGDNATCIPCGTNDNDEPSITVCPEENTSYTVIVTDANGCTNSKSVTVVVKQNINVSISGDHQVCVGESSVLTASGGSSYIWSTGQTTPSISVNPAVTTTYSVTVTDTNACRGSDDFTLTILPLPDITISGKDTICVGECTTLTASGGVTYQWNVPSNADCDGGYFIGGQQNNGPQSLYRFTAAGALQLIGATNTTRLNGNGFYCQNNNPRLFGMVRKGDAITTAIRADFAITDARSGNTQVLGEIPLPPNPYGLGGVSGILNFIGEVTPQGNFLFPAISALINPFTFQIEQYTVYIGQIDVNNHGNGANVTYVPLTIDPSCDPYMEACVEAFRAYALNPAGREPSGGIQDWTLSPDGNSLYAFLGIENGLLRIDLPSRTAFCTPGPASNLAFTGTVGAQTDEFGGMYFDNNRLIGWQVDRGRLFEINPSTGALSLISSSLPLDYRGDNATCIPCGTNDNDEPSITVCPEENTSYTVIVTDANGCTNSKSVTVVVKQNINVSISGDHQVCVGESSVLTASGGSSYIWSTGQTTPSISVNPAVTTTYSVTVTDTNACRGSDDFTLTVLPLPDITISGKDTICVGECTTLTASGGVTYQWNVPSNADCDGGYFIGGQQNNGPQSLYRFTAAGALQLIGATNTTRLNGNGFYCQNNDPRLFGMVRKGDAITTAIRADFAITDARSGNTQVLGEIPLPPNPYGLGGVSGILNFIGEVTPQGNFLFPAISALINPFTFQIEQYTVYIGQIDVNNHGNGANVTYVPLTIDPSCDPYMEACVEAFRAYALNPAGREPSGGIQDWTLSPDGNSLYAFLGIENGLLRIDLPSRTAFCTPGPASNLAFTGTVGAQTDEFGGMYFDNNRLVGWQVDRGRLFEINPSTGALSLISSSLPLDYRGDNATCIPCGTNDNDEPSITVCPEENTSYTVIVTDTNGCTNSKSVTVVVQEFENVVITGNKDICFGERTTLTAPLGISYLWSTGETGRTITVSPTTSTTYTVTITRDGKCDGVGSFTVNFNPDPIIIITGNNTICLGECTFLQATGGTTYQWSGGIIQSNAASIEVCPLVNTTYFITVTNDAGCKNISSVTVTVKDTITANITGKNIICKGETTTISVSGGQHYLWSNGATSSSIVISPLSTTTYSVTISENGKCDKLANFTVIVNPIPDVDIIGDSELCFGDCTRLEVGHGNTYVWTGPGINATSHFIDICPSVTSTYSLTVTNSEGCSANKSITVFVNDQITASITGNNLICNGSSTTLTANGGQTYLWSTGQTTSVITVSPLFTTTYSVTVSNGNNCFSTAQINVTLHPIPDVEINGNAILCKDECTTLEALGGVNYSWSAAGFSSNNSVIEVCPSETTTYSVIVTDINGCTNSKSIEVIINNPATITISGTENICLGEFVTLTATGGVSYVWNTGATTSSIMVNPDVSTTYTVTSLDANGCFIFASKLVNVHPKPSIFIVYKSEICQGSSSNIRANGGEQYLWSTGETTASISVSPDINTWYIVTVTNGFLCSDVDSVEIIVKPRPNISISGLEQICLGDSAVVVSSVDSYNKCPDECKITNPQILAIWDLESCASFPAAGTNFDYSEFLPVTFAGPCLNVTATNVKRNIGAHSCSYGHTGTDIGMCVEGQNTCNSSKVNYEEAVRFSIKIRPGQTGRITGLQFYETSPEQFQWVMGDSGPNNYLQKYLIRILKDGKIVYFRDDMSSLRNWNLVNFDFSGNNNFAFSKETEYVFEIVPYCPVGNGAVMSVWDINDIKIFGGCCAEGNHGSLSYVWSNGSTDAGFIVKPDETSLYSVTVTDCCGCVATEDFEVRVNDIKVDLGPDVYIEEGQTITLRGDITDFSICPDPLTALEYKWSTGATSDSIVVSPAISYVYSLTVTDCLECKGKGRKFVFVNPRSNRTNVIYPNPTAGKFQVLNFDVLDNNTKISLYSVDGKLIGGNEIPFRRITELHLEIDLPSHFENGLYILEINNNGIITRTQLIVVK
ncbi:MAG: T9SS type A sorting domain-containing protein [Saprospiraceae bacterium]|nr:T9SS type A sorting domain-containing protein [Saprospiraceae bacterium]